MSLSSKNRNTVAILIIAAASLALYFNTLHNGFVWDDADQVKCNVWIRSIKFIPTILTVNTWGFMNGNTNYYRPGMHLGYMLVYHLFGPGPMGFHLLNIVFNAGVSVMVFLLALEVFETGGISSRRAFGVAFFSALLFTAHPAHTEAVAWIASFPELSYTLFYLLSLYFFILWRKGEVKEGISLSCLFFVLSFMCKETALSLPLAIAAYEIAFPAKDGRTGKTASWPFRVKIMLPYLALATAYFVLRLRIIGGFVKPMKYALHLTVFQWILNAIGNFSMYLGQL
ncbi:MAG: hypothetical protein M0018_12335, partial [Nitrospiraceae bacterium]|nr:hypothetical protein [Nitrospiraceae bacterium]